MICAFYVRLACWSSGFRFWLSLQIPLSRTVRVDLDAYRPFSLSKIQIALCVVQHGNHTSNCRMPNVLYCSYNSIIIEKRPDFMLKFNGLARRHTQEDYSVLQIIQEYLKSSFQQAEKDFKLYALSSKHNYECKREYSMPYKIYGNALHCINIGIIVRET